MFGGDGDDDVRKSIFSWKCGDKRVTDSTERDSAHEERGREGEGLGRNERRRGIVGDLKTGLGPRWRPQTPQTKAGDTD